MGQCGRQRNTCNTCQFLKSYKISTVRYLDPSESSNLTISPPLSVSILLWMTHSFEAVVGEGQNLSKRRKVAWIPPKGSLCHLIISQQRLWRILASCIKDQIYDHVHYENIARHKFIITLVINSRTSITRLTHGRYSATLSFCSLHFAITLAFSACFQYENQMKIGGLYTPLRTLPKKRQKSL